jgi:hypothetical protein
VPAPGSPRRVGLLLVVVVLLAVAVVPGVRPRTVAGTASAPPVPAPPTPGQCVLEPIDPLWNAPSIDDRVGGGSATTSAYPRLTLGPCGGSRYGEVTTVTTTPAEPVIGVGSDGTFANDPAVDTCAPAASRYIGLAMTGSQRAPLAGGWYPSQTVDAAATIPSRRQAASGQHWLACIAYLGASPVNPLAVADQERYDGSLRDALSTGRQRNRIGTCATDADLTGGVLGLVACTPPHRSELFAAGGSGTQPLERADLQQSCDLVAHRLTGIRDLDAAGFTVEVQAIASTGVPITTASIPAGVNVSCGVTARNGRQLNGSLLALGGQPIPWAN